MGAAAGAALGGLFIDAVSVRAAFLVGPVAAALGALVALAGRRLLAPAGCGRRRNQTAGRAASANGAGTIRRVGGGGANRAE